MNEIYDDARIAWECVHQRPVMLQHGHDLEPVVTALNVYMSVHISYDLP